MSGEERIRRYVERAFYGTRQSDEVQAEKEALCGELIKKYRDLLAEEYSPETAYQSVIGGIGDIFELVDEIAGAPGDAPSSGGNAGVEGQDSRREAERSGTPEEASPAWLRAVPWLAAGVFLLAWGGNRLLHPGPRGGHFFPVLVLAAAVAAAVWLIRRGKGGGAAKRRMDDVLAGKWTAKDIAETVIWCVAAVWFLLALHKPHLERTAWLIPLGALAAHELAAAWFSYMEERGRSDEK